VVKTPEVHHEGTKGTKDRMAEEEASEKLEKKLLDIFKS
jgi:hypothetical protein